MEKDDYKKAQSDLKKARTAYQNQLKLHKKNNGDAESLLKSKENYLACQLNVLQLSGDEQNKSKAQAFIQAKEKKEILENMIQQMKADPHYEMLQKVEQQYQKSSDTYQVEYKKAATDPNQQRK